jgi:hypothetical protein
LPENSDPRGYILAKSGDVDGARQLLRRLDAGPPAWGHESQRAFTYLGLGDTASALSALERATDAKEIWPLMASIGGAPYDPIRRSARFRDLLKRVGLADYYPSSKGR